MTTTDQVTTRALLDATLAGALPRPASDGSVLWQAFQEGARENRWIPYLRGPSLAIGASEMAEWPAQRASTTRPSWGPIRRPWIAVPGLRQTDGGREAPASADSAGDPCPLLAERIDSLATEDLERGTPAVSGPTRAAHVWSRSSARASSRASGRPEAGA